jgi:hypothetical protein
MDLAAPVDLERDEPVATRDASPSTAARDLPAIQTPPVRTGGLHDRRRIDPSQQRRRDRSPASVMREFHDRCRETRLAGQHAGDRLVLHVTAEQQPRRRIAVEPHR